MDISVEYSWGYVHHANMAVLSLTPDVLSTWKGLVHDFTISLLIKPLGLFINKTFKLSSARVLVLGRFKLVKMIHIFFFSPHSLYIQISAHVSVHLRCRTARPFSSTDAFSWSHFQYSIQDFTFADSICFYLELNASLRSTAFPSLYHHGRSLGENNRFHGNAACRFT